MSAITNQSLKRPLDSPFKAYTKKKARVDVPLMDHTNTLTKSLFEEKSSRKVIAAEKNVAPTVSDIVNLKEGVREHAYLRVQLFFVASLALWKKGVRSSGDYVALETNIQRAKCQVGRATNGYHAAHSNAAAGFVENRKENLIEELVEEGITPLKRKLLLAKGISEAQLAQIEAKHSHEKTVRQIIDTVWPEKGILDGTPLELVLNATNSLPRAVNLQSDKPLEKRIRPFVADLYRQLMRGEIDPKKATSIYVTAIQNHFKETIALLETDPNKQQLKLYCQWELEGTQEPNYHYLLNEQEDAWEESYSLLKPSQSFKE